MPCLAIARDAYGGSNQGRTLPLVKQGSGPSPARLPGRRQPGQGESGPTRSEWCTAFSGTFIHSSRFHDQAARSSSVGATSGGAMARLGVRRRREAMGRVGSRGHQTVDERKRPRSDEPGAGPFVGRGRRSPTGPRPATERHEITSKGSPAVARRPGSRAGMGLPTGSDPRLRAEVGR